MPEEVPVIQHTVCSVREFHFTHHNPPEFTTFFSVYIYVQSGILIINIFPRVANNAVNFRFYFAAEKLNQFVSSKQGL